MCDRGGDKVEFGVRVKLRVRGRREEETLIQQRWSGWSMTETAGRGAWGDTGEGLGGTGSDLREGLQ